MLEIYKHLSLVVLPAIASVLILISYIPQIKKTYSTKNVEGQSLSFWVLLTITLLFLFNQQLALHFFTDANVITGILSQGFNLICALVILYAVIRFKK